MKLSQPSEELAARLVAKVGYEKRLVGVRMTPMAGVLEFPIYGLEEAVNFLQVDSFEEVLAGGPRASIPYVDPNALKRWVEEVFGDTELAEALGDAIEEGTNYVETIRPIKGLMEQRLSQCKAVLEDKGVN